MNLPAPLPPVPPELTAVFENLGAAPQPAQTMAAQLWKRAHQIAAENNRPPDETLRDLLEKVVAGRQGNPPPQADLPPTQTPPENP